MRDDSHFKGIEKSVCPRCGRPMPLSWHYPICPICKDDDLYHEVKDYILHNDVTELQVADHFGIPLSKIRQWIKEGYIDYRIKKETPPSDV